MARAMAAFANASENGDARQKAARQLWQSMVLHPENIAGEGKACTELMRACSEPVALKYGAEGFYIGILPNRGLGLALKVSDGALRGAECSVAALLVRLGVLDANHPAALKFMTPTILSKAGLLAGRIAPSPGLL
jgi:L-asparaginase II